MNGEFYDSWGSDAQGFNTNGIAIGIDLGTTNSCVGVWDRQKVKIITHSNLSRKLKTIPSIVQFDKSEIHAGEFSDRISSLKTVSCIKRLMGKTLGEVKMDQRYLSYQLIGKDHEMVKVGVVGAKKNTTLVYSPEEVSSFILKQLKQAAEERGACSCDKAVVTVPAYFDDRQRKATLKAAKLAGFKAVRLLNEPTAAAMAYGLFVAGKKRVLVFDMGGGTFDVSIMHINDGIFDVLGVGGDTKLGGHDVNQVMLEYVVDQMHEKWNCKMDDLTASLIFKIQTEMERVKVSLSVNTVETIVISNAYHGKTFELEISKLQFEQLCTPIAEKCIAIVQSVLHEANLVPKDIDEIICVGGSTKIPCTFSFVNFSINEVVVIKKMLLKKFPGKELCVAINPDTAVAIGAAIQGAILSGVDHYLLKDVLMLDVIPLSIGVQKADGRMEVLLLKNSKIPIQETKYFETFEDGQKGISVDLYEGESEIAKENVHISNFNFILPKSKRGKAGNVKHPVSITMNENGILQVQAGIHHDSENAPMSNESLYIMSAYIIILMILYLVVKYLFPTAMLD